MSSSPISAVKFFMKTAESFGIEKSSEKMRVLLDFVHCKLKFKCKLTEYFRYEYFNHKDRYRRYFLTSHDRNSTYLLINQARFTESKLFCYERLKKYYSREILNIDKISRDDFISFVKEKGKVVLKPDKGSCGVGIEIFSYTDDESIRKKFDEISGKDFICEEYIRQHETLKNLCPTSVNTSRIITLFDGEKTKVLGAVLRMSKGKGFVDNVHSDGIAACVDLLTGVLVYYGKDINDKGFVFHPMTGACIPGTQLPFWQEALYVVSEAHKLIPECALLGWDIAFAENGIEIVEVNSAPDPMVLQHIYKKPKGKILLEFASKKENRKYNLKDNNYGM